MRVILLAVTALAPLLAGGRSGAIGVVLSVLGVTATRGELRPKMLLALGGLFLALFFGGALLVKKGGASLDASLSDNARALVQGLRDYALGGVAGFQRVLMHPGEVPSTMGVTRTFAEIANHLGASIDVPPLHAAFSTIGYRESTNVYTMYFGYLDYGYLGAALLTFGVGFLTTRVYQGAMRGSAIAMAVYGTLIAGMMLSVFNESFYSNVNFLLKLVLGGLLLTKRLPSTPARR